MFKQTLRRLTLLNSLVFLMIFVIFTSIVYGYISLRLFDKVDAAMRFQADNFRITEGRATLFRGRSPIFDPRIFILLRGEDGRIINLAPFRSEEANNLVGIAEQFSNGQPQTIEYEDHTYRGMVFQYRQNEKLVNEKLVNLTEKFLVKEVIAVSIVDSEVGLLNNLMLIIISGIVVGMAVIILAGYLLARRAMVPIEAAWDKQQQFVADASHELRSPITGIHSNAELMLRHPAHTIEQESFRINNIMKESTRMTKLITSLLTLARSDANKADLHWESVNFSDLVEIAVEHFRAVEEINKVVLKANIQEGLMLTGDQDRLHQLIVILLDNAFKYTQLGGQITILAAKSGKNIVFSVEDTGCGITPENLPHVFDRFFRGDKARTRDNGGTGLGLAIAKWIADKHNGKIEVLSEPGKGSKFTLYIPVVKSK